eukprot:scaffold153_cov347-Pavlova_lutheri.AAC.27
MPIARIQDPLRTSLAVFSVPSTCVGSWKRSLGWASTGSILRQCTRRSGGTVRFVVEDSVREPARRQTCTSAYSRAPSLDPLHCFSRSVCGVVRVPLSDVPRNGRGILRRPGPTRGKEGRRHGRLYGVRGTGPTCDGRIARGHALRQRGTRGGGANGRRSCLRPAVRLRGVRKRRRGAWTRLQRRTKGRKRKMEVLTRGGTLGRGADVANVLRTDGAGREGMPPRWNGGPHLWHGKVHPRGDGARNRWDLCHRRRDGQSAQNRPCRSPRATERKRPP